MGAVFLSRDHGLPSIGVQKHKVSCLASDAEYIYIALDRPKRELRSEIYGTTYGALFRWKPGMQNVELVCSSQSLAPGPLNDCTPYSMLQSSTSDDCRRVMFRVKWGPYEGWWQYTGSENRWEYIGGHTPQSQDTGRWIIKNPGRPVLYERKGSLLDNRDSGMPVRTNDRARME